MLRVSARVTLSILLLLVSGFQATPAQATRIKDIGSFMGSRSNQLIGYGLVVGLNGSGDKDKTIFTVSTLANLLDNMGIHVDPLLIKVKNVAAVMITANFPPFLRSGSRVDVQVSSTGDATSLQGGTLLMAPLKGPDGQVYAVAQGPITLGGFSAGGAAGSVTKNHPTVGFISGGALVEREVPNHFGEQQQLVFVLKAPDFSTAMRASQTINGALGGANAQAVDAATIRVEVPPQYLNKLVEVISQMENLQIKADAVAKVIINERTGTVVMGEHVRISPVAIAHGGLTVQISEEPRVSQPQPFSNGKTVVTPSTEVQVQEKKGSLALVGSGVSIAEVVKGLNAIGVSPRDLITILQTIKAAGALQAELEII
jgi:flagellar P-ring protein precursor FlgI